MFTSHDELKRLIRNDIDYSSPFGQQAIKNFFCYNGSKQAFSGQMIPYYRDSKNYLFSATGLHIFVVTNACNMKCVYCQAQTGKCYPDGMMSIETAKKAVDIAMSSPQTYLSFEFQGGEPLINFKAIKHIVEYSSEIAEKHNKVIEYSIVSNLTLLTEEIADYILEHNISVSTSIDGNEFLHNTNRKYRNDGGTFQDVIKGINILANKGIGYGAIQTTTKKSFDKFKEIIDTYISLKIPSVFIRNLTPLGCANNEWPTIGYSPEQFVLFYKNCFNYIVEKNMNGTFIREGHASIFLQKILSGYAANYMELRSPCGAGVGQIAYYYDGNIYTCDEGRMLAEMGDSSFLLGTVNSTYDDLMSCNNCKAVCISSVLESLPNCCDCVYQPFCGTCPVINLALKNDIYNKEPNDYKCKIYKGMLDTIFEALQYPQKEKILKSWI